MKIELGCGQDMDRENSMILTFHVPPLARGYGLCDIDSISSRNIRKISKILEVQEADEISKSLNLPLVLTRSILYL